MKRVFTPEVLTGPAGTGKTLTVLNLFREKILASGYSGLNEPSFLILPNREHTDRLEALLFRDDRVKGLLNAHLLTIEDFIRLKVKRPERRTVSQFERIWILKQLLTEGDWPWMARARHLKGLYPLLADFVREIKNHTWSTRQFKSKAMRVARQDPYFKLKSQDLIHLLEAYDECCRKMGVHDPSDEILDFSNECLHSHRSPYLDLVIFDGFHSFTQAQLTFIKAMRQISRKLLVTLTLDKKRSKVFYFPLQTLGWLKRLGFHEEVMGKHQPRYKTQDLSWLESHLFGTVPSTQRKSPQFVEIFEASTIPQEIEMMAREILKLQRTDFHFSDIMIILRDLGEYRPHLEEVLGRLGVPYEIHERIPLSENPIIGFLLSWLRLFEGKNLRREGFLQFIRSSFTAFEPLDIECWETKLWEEGDVFPATTLDAKFDMPMLSEAGRERSMNIIGMVKRYLECKQQDLKPFFEDLIELGNRGESVQLENPETRQCVNTFFDRLEDHCFGGGDSNDRLALCLEMNLYSMPSSDKNCVQIYDVSLAIPKEYRVAFIAGLSDGRFPRRLYQDPLLSDAERVKLSGSGPSLATTHMKSFGERFYFYMALTRARERVYLTHAVTGSKGMIHAPSSYLEEIKNLLGQGAKIRRRKLADVLPGIEEIRTDQDVAHLFCYEAFHNEKSPLLKDLMLIMEEQSKLGGAKPLELFRRLEGQVSNNGFEDPNILRQLQTLERPFSVSEITRLHNCGFQFFANDLLKPSRVWDSPEVQEGLMLHKVLENVYRKVTIDKAGPENSLEDQLLGELEKLWDTFPFMHDRPYRSSVRKRVLQQILKSFSRSQEGYLKDLKPFHHHDVERAFGSSQNPYLNLVHRGQKVDISGRMDRLDLDDDGRQALIVDYKRSGEMRVKDLLAGNDLSLPLYALAARKLWGLDVLGAYIVSLKKNEMKGFFKKTAYQRPRTRSPQVLTDEAFEGLLDKVQSKVMDAAQKLKRGDISARSRSCKHCSYYGMCRFEGWSSRK
jgi:ATP-dependent helicase/nuclease subunit B